MNPISCVSHSLSMSPPAAVAEVESVLHGGDVSDGSGDGELLERDIADADVPDLAFVLKIFERADRLREGDGWVGGVQLVEIDAVELEPEQRCLAGGAECPGRPLGSSRSARRSPTSRWARCVRSRPWSQ